MIQNNILEKIKKIILYIEKAQEKHQNIDIRKLRNISIQQNHNVSDTTSLLL